jgi:hypothetical protein
MSETPEELRTEAQKRRLEAILAEIELAITLQRLSFSERSLGFVEAAQLTHGDAVESLGRARNLLSQSPPTGDGIWQGLDAKITELETLLLHRAA